MQRIDLLIIGTLVVAAAASALGVATYEDDRRAAFRVEWVSSEVLVDGEPADGGFTAEVTALNVTRAVWTITVNGAPARIQPVAIHVEVVAPDNTTSEAEGELPAGPGASVDVPVEIDLAAVPSLRTATGASVDAARASLPVIMNGTGTWTIRVLVAAGAVPETITTQAAGALTTYAAELSTEAPEVARG